MTIIDWAIQDTRRKIAAEESGDRAASEGIAAGSPPVSIRGTIDRTPGRGASDAPAKRERSRVAAYGRRQAGRM
jgi:hypothetical protein